MGEQQLRDLVGLLRRPELAMHVQRTALHGFLLREGRSSAMRLAAHLGVRVSWQDTEWDLVRALPDQAVPLGEAQRLHDHVETALRRHVKAITQEALDAPEVSCG